MRFSKIALGLGLALAASTALVSTANAAKFTVDYRHDYRTGDGENFDRICFIGALENGVGFYVDSSFKSGSERPGNDQYHDGQWGDFVTNATEMSLWWAYKFEGTGFTLTPGIITESTSETTGYKPYLRLQYNTDFGLWFALRPRYDYWRYDDKRMDQRNGRIDAWIGYNKGNFGINYNYTYMWALNDKFDDNGNVVERHMYNGKDHNYEHNIAMNYRFGQWNPYLEIGDIADNGTAEKSGRQARIRVGIQYTF